MNKVTLTSDQITELYKQEMNKVTLTSDQITEFYKELMSIFMIIEKFISYFKV